MSVIVPFTPRPAPVDQLRERIDASETISALTALMLSPETLNLRASLPPDEDKALYAYARLRAYKLGYPRPRRSA